MQRTSKRNFGKAWNDVFICCGHIYEIMLEKGINSLPNDKF